VRNNPSLKAIRLPDGPQLHYAEQGDANGEPILLLHGWPDSWFSFSRVLPLLPDRFRTFALDQRGFGDSERPQGDYSIERFAADAADFLDAVGVERASVVGHSFGSFVARRLAIARPERIARLVLIGTGVSAAAPVFREVQAAIRDLADPVPVEFARDFQASTVYAPLPDAFFDRIVAESLKLPARLWRDAWDGLLAYDDAAKLRAIAAPTLLLRGDHDALFSHDDQVTLLAAIASATLKTYEETGHCPNWEKPDQVAADLAAFLRVE